MPVAQAANQDQATLWNERSGPVWVELQALLDYQLAVIAFETSQQTSTARLLSLQ